MPISTWVPTGVEVEVEARADMPARLRRTQGFVVETDSGRFGTVEDFQVSGRSGMPACLVVRGGLFGRRRMMISVGDIAQVLPRQRLVRLRSTWVAMQA
jgi:hypothetical protein